MQNLWKSKNYNQVYQSKQYINILLMKIWIQSEAKYFDIDLQQNFYTLKEIEKQIRNSLKLINKTIKLFYIENNARIELRSYQQIKRVFQLGLRVEAEITVDTPGIHQKFNRENLYSISSSLKNKQQKIEKGKEKPLKVRKYNIEYINNNQNTQEEYLIRNIKKNTPYQYQYLIQNASSWSDLNQKTFRSSKPEVIEIIKNEIIQNKYEYFRDKTEEWSNMSLCDEEVQTKYQCYICEGNGLIKSKNSKKDKKCHICKGEKSIDTSNPLIKFLDELIQDKINAIFKFKVKSETKVQNLHSMSNKGIYQPYAVTFPEQPQKDIKCEFGDQYSWTLFFYNSGSQNWPDKKIHLYEIYPKNKKVLEIRSLNRKQKCQITIILRGDIEGTNKVIYRFGYINQKNKIIHFGKELSYQLSVTPKEQKLQTKQFDYCIQETNLHPNFLLNSNQTKSMRAVNRQY